MTIAEQKINALAAYVMADDEETRQVAKNALKAAMNLKEECTIPSDAEQVIHDLFAEIGAPPNLVGYKYAVYGILQAIEKPELLDRIVDAFYPSIALRFSTTSTRAERAIRHLVEQVFSKSDYETLEKYFGNLMSCEKGKITNSCFIARCAIIVKSRIKN